MGVFAGVASETEISFSYALLLAFIFGEKLSAYQEKHCDEHFTTKQAENGSYHQANPNSKLHLGPTKNHGGVIFPPLMD
jgi:hypothetical protein